MDVFSRIEGQGFVWDSDKAASNIGKHGISFATAALIFFDDQYILEDASVEGEERLGAIGWADGPDLLYVVHIELKAGLMRIISAREATRRESKLYAYQR